MAINEENISFSKVFNKYGNDFESEKDLKYLKAQQRKRAFVVTGFLIVGAVGGYILGKQLKLSKVAKFATTLAGSVLIGGSVFMLTKKKAETRKKVIEEKEQSLEHAKYLSERLKELATPKTPTYVLTNPTKPDETFKDVMSPIIINK